MGIRTNRRRAFTAQSHFFLTSPGSFLKNSLGFTDGLMNELPGWDLGKLTAFPGINPSPQAVAQGLVRL
jgi:hypothetical protein